MTQINVFSDIISCMVHGHNLPRFSTLSQRLKQQPPQQQRLCAYVWLTSLLHIEPVAKNVHFQHCECQQLIPLFVILTLQCPL